MSDIQFTRNGIRYHVYDFQVISRERQRALNIPMENQFDQDQGVLIGCAYFLPNGAPVSYRGCLKNLFIKQNDQQALEIYHRLFDLVPDNPTVTFSQLLNLIND